MENKSVKIKLDLGATMPTRAHETDAGLDLYSMEDKIIYPTVLLEPSLKLDWIATYHKNSETFDTGVHIAFDRGTYGKIESRSGLNVNHSVVSCGGVIDEGYTGSIKVKLYNFGTRPYSVHAGDKIAQLIIMPYLTPELELVDDLDDTERGDNGFGSTGV